MNNAKYWTEKLAAELATNEETTIGSRMKIAEQVIGMAMMETWKQGMSDAANICAGVWYAKQAREEIIAKRATSMPNEKS